jgi:hypothetical protein
VSDGCWDSVCSSVSISAYWLSVLSEKEEERNLFKHLSRIVGRSGSCGKELVTGEGLRSSSMTQKKPNSPMETSIVSATEKSVTKQRTNHDDLIS